jgi:hypothetical protein
MMPEPKKTRCVLLADGESFAIRRGDWGQTLPTPQLDAQIALYEALRDREGGKYAKFYSQTVQALQNLKKRIGERS